MTNLIDIMDAASNKMKYPKLRFVLEDERTVVFARKGDKAKAPGSISIQSPGSFETREWYGTVNRDGSVFLRDNTPRTVRKMVDLLVKYTRPVIEAYGHKSSRCCFCAAELTDVNSTEAGYGPVCAANYGLPWGSAS